MTQSLSSIVSKVRAGFYAATSQPEVSYYAIEIFEDYLIAEEETWSADSGWQSAYYRIAYSSDSDGTLTFAQRDAWQQVERQTEWVANRRQADDGQLVTLTFETNANEHRREMRQGREFLVTPSQIANAVMNRVYYPSVVWNAGIGSFNGRPIVNDHPDETVSANDPSVPHYGAIFNAMIADGLPSAEFWFDVDLCNADDEMAALLTRIGNGEAVEISTGLVAALTKQSGMINNREYDAVALHISGDHVAVLPQGVAGACSVDDGCGINNSQQRGERSLFNKFMQWIREGDAGANNAQPATETPLHNKGDDMAKLCDESRAEVGEMIANAVADLKIGETVTNAVTAAMEPVQAQMQVNAQQKDALESAEKASIVTALTNSATVPFGKELLEKLALNTLREMAQEVRVPDAAVHGGALIPQPQTEEWK